MITPDKKNIFLKIILFVVLVSLIIWLAIDVRRREAVAPGLNHKDQTVVNNLKEESKIALEKAKTAAVRPVRPIDESDHIWGDLNAPVKLIIYDDFQCPFCARFYDTVEEIKKEFGDKVVIAFRHFPLRFHLHAYPAALASECAAEQGKFWEMYAKLFADNKAGRLDKNQFKQDAVDLGLDQAKFNQCLDTEKYKDKIQAQMVEGRNFGVNGTPGNFINGEPVPGAIPFEDFTDSSGRQREGVRKIIQRHLNDTPKPE
jgi:protein-disulfide isomerase